MTPEGLDVRPTGDRVREAVFNSLGSMDALAGATVLDLFSGSGAMGIEALSRGAAQVTFVDDSARSIEATRANLASCALASRSSVVRSDAFSFLNRVAADPDHSGFDLVILDPPYAFDDWAALLERIQANVVVIESDRRIDLTPPTGRAGLTLSRERRYGGTFVTIAIGNGREVHGRASEGRK